MKVCVWYLYHSGVAVETEKSFLVFDYWRDTPAGGLAVRVRCDACFVRVYGPNVPVATLPALSVASQWI